MDSGFDHIRRDPATSLISAKVLNDGPIGVPSLREAAQLLQVDLREVKAAAITVTPWTRYGDEAKFWSVRQLARSVVLNRISAPPARPAPEWEDEPVPAKKASKAKKPPTVKVEFPPEIQARPPVRTAPKRRKPGPRKGFKHRPHDHRNAYTGPIMTREQAESAAVVAERHSTLFAAEQLGLTAVTLRRAWNRFGLSPKVPTGGKAAKAYQAQRRKR